MNTKRNSEIAVVVAAMTVTAAMVSGLLTARSANAAPGKKTTATKKAPAKRVVKVKISGSRRAAINRAEALNRVTASPARDEATPGSIQVEAYGEPTQVRGNTPQLPTPVVEPLNSTPVSNLPGVVNTVPGIANSVPGVVNNFGPNPFALYGPPLINTGNGFAPLYGTGYNMNGYTAAPYNGAVSPYANRFGGGFYSNGSVTFGY